MEAVKVKSVDLLVVETEQFTLAIEGDLDTTKYARFVEETDGMTLQFRGLPDDARVQLFDVATGGLVTYKKNQPYLPIFFENGQYMVVVQSKDGQHLSFYHEYEPFCESVKYRPRLQLLSGVLHFQNEVGLSSFEIRGEHGQVLLEVTLEVFPTKLDYKKDYQALLGEVNEEIYNLAYHFIGRTYLRGSAKIFKDPSLAEFYRLFQVHVNQYMKSIEQIERMPHHQLKKEYVEVHGSRLRRQDSVSRAYLRKNAARFVDVERGIALVDRHVMPAKGLLLKKEHTTDTHENRYVKWTMERIAARLQHLEHILRKSQGMNSSEALDMIVHMQALLQQKLNSVFWRSIGKLDRSVASLVLQMAPGYREVYQIYSTLSQSIVLQGELYKMSIKDIATLYEYWTFIKLSQIVGRTCKTLSQDVVQVRRDGLFVNLDRAKSATRVYKHPVTGEDIILTYQYKPKKGLPTGQQIPDTMLSIGKKGKNYYYQYVFDAKYRIDIESSTVAGPKQDDINTMHRYRDSIVVEQNGTYERTAFGAFVLFPWHEEQSYVRHPFYQSIEKVNIGGLPFLPNHTQLVEQMIERLLNKSAEELQREGILPIGTMVYSKEENGNLLVVHEDALLNRVASFDDQLVTSIDLRCDSLAVSLVDVKQVAIGNDDGVYVVADVFSIERRADNVCIQIGHIEEHVLRAYHPWSDAFVVEVARFNFANSMPELFVPECEAEVLSMFRRLSEDVQVKLVQPEIRANGDISHYVVNGKSFVVSELEIVCEGVRISRNRPLHEVFQDVQRCFR